MCECLNDIRANILKDGRALYVKIDCSTILKRVKGEPDKEDLTGQRIEIGFTHVKKDGTPVKKSKKTFITHDYCPFCGVKY